MPYMTIVLELLKERTGLHEQLRLTRRLLPTVETCAQELRESHFAWTEHLSQAHPDCERTLIASDALEIAIKELEERLPLVTTPDDQEPLSLDQAMAFVRNPTSRK